MRSLSAPDTHALRPRTLQASGLVLAGLALAAVALVVTAPTDRVQGIVQKILYVHVPCAFAAYLGFVITAVAGALYLWRNDERFDRVAASAAEVGVLFCTLNILSGPIWAKATWGHWWAWDPRLTVTLVLWDAARQACSGQTGAARSTSAAIGRGVVNRVVFQSYCRAWSCPDSQRSAQRCVEKRGCGQLSSGVLAARVWDTRVKPATG